MRAARTKGTVKRSTKFVEAARVLEAFRAQYPKDREVPVPMMIVRPSAWQLLTSGSAPCAADERSRRMAGSGALPPPRTRS